MMASQDQATPEEQPKGSAATVLLVEIGGTNIRAGTCGNLDPSLRAIKHRETPNYLKFEDPEPDQLFQRLLDEVTSVSRELLGDARPDGVVVGYPGPITREGIAARSPTILGPKLDRALDVQSAFDELWPSAKVAVLNDLTCAGFLWVARGYQDFCIVTVGSGVGNKVFIDNMPAVGVNARGGEIGHLRATLPGGTPVSSMSDTVGNISSGRGMVWTAQHWFAASPEDLSGSCLAETAEGELRSEDLVSAFLAGDGLAFRIINTASFPLAHALAGIHLAIGIEQFFITGGFAKALGEPYRSVLVENVRACAWDVGQDWNGMIELGPRDVDEGLVGAAYYAVHHVCNG